MQWWVHTIPSGRMLEESADKNAVVEKVTTAQDNICLMQQKEPEDIVVDFQNVNHFLSWILNF